MEIGDVILEAVGHAVNQPADISAALAEAKKNNRKAVLLRVKGSEGTHFVAIAITQGDSGKSPVVTAPSPVINGLTAPAAPGGERRVVTYPNGDRYEGEFRDGKRNGHGVYTYADGKGYEGEFLDGKYNGRGVETFANGDRYDGEFRDGKKNGQGVYTFANGDRYDGAWSDDKPTGKAPNPMVRAPSFAVFPSAISPSYAGEKPAKARLKTCNDHYKANEATNANGGLNWIQKGGGYWSECNKRLKG